MHLSATIDSARAKGRLAFPVLLFVIEATTFFFTVNPKIGGGFALRWTVFTALAFVVCGTLKHRSAFRGLLGELRGSPIRARFLIYHFGALAIVLAATRILAGGLPGLLQASLVAGLWYAALVAAIVCASLAFVRWPAIERILQATGLLWLYAALVGLTADFLVVLPAVDLADSTIWLSGIRPTYALVRFFLQFFVARVVEDPQLSRIGTERFSVRIGMGCTGIEGMTLTLVFAVSVLWFFHEELRFPRSLLLAPAGVGLIYVLNAVRITTLILIGHAGAAEVAKTGFHSGAGWIFLTCVAIGMVYAAQFPWLLRDAAGLSRADAIADAKADAKADADSTTAYLLPIIAILATAMITRALSAGFDWLYPMRFVVATAVLWAFRDKYRDLDWHFSVESVVLGAAVFGMWILLSDNAADAAAGKSFEAGLSSLPAWGRAMWLIFRVLGATITVPIAEELAFRGFALRRLQSADFEAVRVSWRSFTWPALIISSLGFGVMHGQLWIAGAIAGLAYAAAMLRRGRLADAVVAHATTNALLAAWVIARHAWWLW